MKDLITAIKHPHAVVWMALRPWRRHSLVLTVGGLVYALVGWTYIITPPTPSRESSLRIPLTFAPIELWGIVWLLVGLLAVASSRWPPASEKWGYTLLSGLGALWASFYVGGVALGGPFQSLSGALVWALVAFVWWAISGLDNPRPRRVGGGL